MGVPGRFVKSLPGLLILLITLWVASGVVPGHVLVQQLPDAIPRTAHFLFPQGWGFFTKDPTGPYYYGQYQDGTDSEQLQRGGGRRLMGWDRSPRIDQEWLAALGEQVPEDKWAPCGPALSSCFTSSTSQAPTPVEITLMVDRRCTDLTIVRHSPTPWAWVKITDEQRFESTNVILDCG